MDYFVLLLAVVCIAAQFSLNKFYQKNYVDGPKEMLFLPFVSGIANIALFALLGFCFYGKLPDFTMFSFLMSLALAVVSTLSAFVGLLIMKYGNMSVYSVFMMLGGMILPYLFGLIFLDEKISAARLLGLAILIFALPCSVANPAKEKKAAKKFYYMLCASIFLLNGTISIISKTHSINIAAVPAANFIVYSNLWGAAINGAAYFAYASHSAKPKGRGANPGRLRAVPVIAICAFVGGIGYLFQLVAAKTVPAVAMYPFITGGSIVASTIAARIFFGEKLGKPAMAGIAISLFGTLLFLF